MARSVFYDFVSTTSFQVLIKQAAELAFHILESEVEQTLDDLIRRTYISGIPNKSMAITFEKQKLASLRRYFVFLRFRNSAKYREIVEFFREPQEQEDQHPIQSSIYESTFKNYHSHLVLRGFVAFLRNLSSGCDIYLNKDTISTRTPNFLNVFHLAMNNYCWKLSDADVSIGIAVEGQEYILPDSCYGTLNEGFEGDPECSDLFFPILPSFALYILGNDKSDPPPPSTIKNVDVEVGIESASDVHLRNSMILHTYPQHLYFSGLQPMALSLSSYDEFRWNPEHQDYSRLKQRCRQKFLQETVTKTLIIKNSIVLTDLTEEVVPIGTCAVGHGGFADVWKGVWNDPIEKRPRHVAVKVLRAAIVKDVKEKMMKRLHSEVLAWHQLSHRNINQLFGIVHFCNSIGMVSSWCENGTIVRYLRDNTKADRLSLIMQVASGVAYLHSATPVVVHGDLKGANILINAHGCPIITDFGLSKVWEDLSDTMDIKTSSFAGSTRWMAPELIKALIEDDGPIPMITRETDVYAFASVCLEVRAQFMITTCSMRRETGRNWSPALPSPIK
ncbi:hypothetical protein H0H92_009149 [Tricholoma furcatifolium]|nr:hypothetical protein H0H92_009149 [Tricholoma furcatifolium]